MNYNIPDTPLQAYNLSTLLEEGTTLSIPVQAFSKLHSMRNGVVAAFKRRGVQKHFKVTTSEKEMAVYITKISSPTSSFFTRTPGTVITCEPQPSTFEEYETRGQETIKIRKYLAAKEDYESGAITEETFNSFLSANNITEQEITKWNN